MRRHLPLLLITGVATGLFELFFHFDWDQGLVRGALVVGLLGLMLAARALGRRITWTPWPRWLLVAVSVGAGALLYWHIKEGSLSAYRQRHSEMGDIHVRAVGLLATGCTPWGFGTVLDSGAFRGLIGAPEVTACRTNSSPPTDAQFDALWYSTQRGDAWFPERISEPGCERARELLAVTGYKYGPAMLLPYVPLVRLMGPGGVYVTHLVFLFAIIAAMALLLRARSPEALVMACVILLGQSVLRRDTLLDSDCDLIPTAFMLFALVAFERERFLLAGCLAALTFAAKIFPAAFLLPLLLNRQWWRSLGGFAAVTLLAWVPAFALDGAGVWDNVVGFNLSRAADSTAPAFFLPGPLLLALRVLVLGACGFAFWKVVLVAKEPVAFVAIAMGLFFLVTKVFHNNYVVWWLPVVGVALSTALASPRVVRTAPAAR